MQLTHILNKPLSNDIKNFVPGLETKLIRGSTLLKDFSFTQQPVTYAKRIRLLFIHPISSRTHFTNHLCTGMLSASDIPSLRTFTICYSFRSLLFILRHIIYIMQIPHFCQYRFSFKGNQNRRCFFFF